MRQRNFAEYTRRCSVVLSGSVESQYLVGSLSPFGHSINSHSSGLLSLRLKSRRATRTRAQAKREDSGSAVPSRQSILRQARLGKPSASSLTDTGWCFASRCKSFGGRPPPDPFLGGSRPVADCPTLVFGRMPPT